MEFLENTMLFESNIIEFFFEFMNIFTFSVTIEK